MGIQYDYILDVIAHRYCTRLPADIETIRCICYDWRFHGWFIAADDVIATSDFIIQKKKLGIMGYRVSREGLEELASLCTKGIMAPVIDRVFPLNETVAAFRYYEKGKL